MRFTTRSLACLLALLMVLSVVATGCTVHSDNGPGESGSETTTPEAGSTETTVESGSSSSPEESETEPDDTNKSTYTVSVKTIGGRGLADLTVYVYEGNRLVDFGRTDANGIATISLPTANGYTVELDRSALEGYDVADRYDMEGNSAVITLTSAVIPDSNLSGVRYKVGDIIRDFTVMTTDGTEFTLSEALKNKKGVLINFFYTTCSPCINEFPYMQSAYEKYGDNIEIIGLNNYAGDTESGVRQFKAEMGLTFPMAKDFSTLGTSFNLQGYPTSIFVDRYGTICLIEIGGLTSEKPFTAAFEHFTADRYEQKLFTSISELTPTEKPNLDMPSAEEIGAILNGNGFTASYYPETGSDDAEYSWPFVIGNDKHGRDVIYASNRYKDGSFATLHADVELKAGEALAIDWFSSSERGVDILYILVDEKDIYQISGESEDWSTCYPFVATEDGTYKVTFIYLKDDGNDVGEDTVYLSNFRIVDKEQIDSATYIPRYAATNPNANGLGYQNYVTVVYNEADGYYHVGTENGPLLLVNLMTGTRFNSTSLNDLGYNGKLKEGNVDYYETLVTYCNYAINGTLWGFSPVTRELKDILEKAAELVGLESDNPNQWLQACSYYDAYGTEEQLPDPVKGIAFFAAYETVESTDTEEKFNTVTYDGRVIMPRGLKFKFVPTKSGAYIIKSQSKDEVNGWLFDEDTNLIYTAEVVDRFVTDITNVSMIVYMEAGKTYYIDIAYYDIYAAGTFTFTVKYLAETYDHFHLASPGPFTFLETSSGQMGETIAGGINVALDEDGFYREVLADGSLGSLVYADFSNSTGLFSHSIRTMIEMGGFDLSKSDTDEEILAKLKELNNDVDACRNYYMELWGDTYEEYATIWMLEDVLAGRYHGVATDYTEAMTAYLDKMITGQAAELEGCVLVDEELGIMLQALMDKFTFEGVVNSWTKLCYYYKHLGPTNG